jgi:hypothetical protein
MICRAGIVGLAMAALAAAAGDPAAAILDQARGTRVEVFADVAFRLLEGNRIPEKNRAALLDEIFLRASEARDAMPMRPAQIPEMSRVAIPAPLHLDALSIKCRVVKALLSVDGKRARERFADIPRPDLPKPDCTTATLPYPEVYFETLGAVVAQAPFTAKEQEKQVPFWMLESAVRGIQTSLEIVEAARNLSHLMHTQTEALAMSNAFAVALGIDDCNRNFTAAIANGNLVDAVLMANDRFAKLGAPPQTMLVALRNYLVRHLTAPRCEDSPGAVYDKTLDAFREAAAGQTIAPPITAEESTPSKIEGKADLPQPVDHPGYQELSNAVKAAGPDDPASFAEVLEKLQAWKGGAEQDPVGLFHRKASLYSFLLGPQFMQHPPPVRPSFLAALAGLIAILSDPAILDAAPTDWLNEVRQLEQRLAARWADIAQAMIDSHLSALSVYGRLAALEHGR